MIRHVVVRVIGQPGVDFVSIISETHGMTNEKRQLVFGVDTKEDAAKMAPAKPLNPCLEVYGPLVPARNCDGCKHLFVKQYARRFTKCDMRKNTNSRRTDHSRYWPACSKFEEEKQ